MQSNWCLKNRMRYSVTVDAGVGTGSCAAPIPRSLSAGTAGIATFSGNTQFFAPSRVVTKGHDCGHFRTTRRA
jgi:hypothetical protein